MFGKRSSARRDLLAQRVKQIGAGVTDAAMPGPSRAREPREAVFRNATLLSDDGQTMRVVIKSLSASGARIEFFNKWDLPGEIEIAEPMLKLRKRARVVWQRDGIAGLQFID